MLTPRAAKGGGDGVVVIDAVNREVRAEGRRFEHLVTLIIVKVKAVAGRGHKHGMPRLGCRDAAVLAAPRHYDCRGVEIAAFENFVPANHALALFGKMLAHAADDVGLQLRLLVITQLLHAQFATVAGCPFRARTFVAADVIIRAGEELHHLVDHVVEETEHQFAPGTHHDVFHAPDAAHRGGLLLAGEFGIGGNGGQFVAGDFQFGHNLHMVLFGKCHHVADFLLRVKSFLHRAVFVHAAAAYFREARIFFDFNAPALVVCQMPVQTIYLIGGKTFYLALDNRGGEEMATGVEHHAAVAEARFVLDAHTGQLPVADHHRGVFVFNGRGEKLYERLHGVVQPGGGRGAGHNFLLRHFERVGFCSFHVLVVDKGDAAL